MERDGVVVGIDLGGTNVRAGALDPQGRILSWAEAPIEAARGPRAGIGRISALIEQTLHAVGTVELRGIGIGATGPVDRERGAIQNPYTLPTWEDVDVVSPLSARFGVPVTLENDADVAALGEYWAGAGQGVERMYMVTVGTGIGTAYVEHGALYRGAHGVHPDGGHQIIAAGGPECYCGATGCWEVLASGPALARLAQDMLSSRHEPSRMLELAGGEIAWVDGSVTAQAAALGDPLALQVMDRYVYFLGLGLVNIMTLFFPDVIILGGGVMHSYELIHAPLRAFLDRFDKMNPVRDMRLEPARLGKEAGVTGAAYAIWALVKGE